MKRLVTISCVILGFVYSKAGTLGQTTRATDGKSTVVIAKQLHDNLGKNVTLSGSAQIRKSGPWVLCGSVAVQVLGLEAWPDGYERGKVSVSGVVEERSGWSQGNMWYAVRKSDMALDREGNPQPSTRPARTIETMVDTTSLARSVGQKVRVVGRAWNEKNGRCVACNGFTIDVHEIDPREPHEWPDAVSDRVIEVTGWVREVHIPKFGKAVRRDGKLLVPGAVVEGGDFYALSDVEWKLKD